MKQLPPVGDTELCADRFDRKHSEQVLAGMALFDGIENVIVLQTIVRQGEPEQEPFRIALNNLRVGKSTIEDYNLFKTRFFCTATLEEKNRFKDATRLYSRKDKVTEYNMDKLARLANGPNPESTCRIDARHTPISLQKAAQAVTSDKMMGLQSSIFLARGARVIICQNVWMAKGLSNGCCGVVKKVIFAVGQGPPSLPLAVVVEMDVGYNGPHLKDKPRHVAFNPVTSFVETFKGHLERTQIPLCLAFAVTIHKCQGEFKSNLTILKELNYPKLNFAKH